MIRVIFACIVFGTSLHGNEVVIPPPIRNLYQRLTTHEELVRYAETIVSRSEAVTLDTLGTTQQNRMIPVLRFSSHDETEWSTNKKLRVFIYCQQHGNEPGGKEAALLLIDWLVHTPGYVLDFMDILVVPQVNPDGAERGERRNGNLVDLNRNHAILTEPESRFIHDLFLSFMPHVTLDVHEYGAISSSWVRNGIVKDADVMLGGVTNLNVDRRITDVSRRVIIPMVGTRVEEHGYRFHRYIVGSPFEGGRMRYSTTDINDGRTSMGLYQTFSFIQEGKRYPDHVEELQRRTESQFLAIRSFLEIIADNADSIRHITEDARGALMDTERTPVVVLQSDYYPDSTETSVDFPVFDLHEWAHVYRDLPGFEPAIRAKKSVLIPEGYLIPETEHRLISVLRRHGIVMQTVSQSRDIVVEGYDITHVTVMDEEELMVPNVDVERRIRSVHVDSGAIIISTRQPARYVIPLLIEPQSTRGLVARGGAGPGHFGAYLMEGLTYPVYRIPGSDPGYTSVK